jgi:hypothetical protein
MTAIREKSWAWHILALFGAHKNYTIVYGTIYYPKGKPPSEQILNHEAVHAMQAEQCGGWTRYYLKYLFLLPFLWNPYRYQWEWEAYTLGSDIADLNWIKKKLRSAMYGWLIFNRPKNKEEKNG